MQSTKLYVLAALLGFALSSKLRLTQSTTTDATTTGDDNYDCDDWCCWWSDQEGNNWYDCDWEWGYYNPGTEKSEDWTKWEDHWLSEWDENEEAYHYVYEWDYTYEEWDYENGAYYAYDTDGFEFWEDEDGCGFLNERDYHAEWYVDDDGILHGEDN